MSYFGKNIRKIRTAKNISQAAFADLFNLTRASIGAYEEGRAEAKIDTIIEIAEYFKLSLDQLLTKELTINDIYHIGKISKKFEISSVKTESNLTAAFISVINRKKFIELFDNQDYLTELLQIKVPGLKKTSIAFEFMQPNEMGFFSKGDILIAENKPIEQISQITDKQLIAVIIENDLQIGTIKNKNSTHYFSSIENQSTTQLIDGKQIKSLWTIYLSISKINEATNGIVSRLSAIENKLDVLIQTTKAQ